MAILGEWIKGFRYLGRRSRLEDDLEEEVRFRLETRAAESPIRLLAHQRGLIASEHTTPPAGRCESARRTTYRFLSAP